MVSFILCSDRLIAYLEYVSHNKKKSFPVYELLFSIFTAICVTIRLAGIIFIGLTIFFISIEIIFHRDLLPRLIRSIFTYLTLTCLFIYLFWPVLWHDPIGEFRNAFLQLSHFPMRSYFKENFILPINYPGSIYRFGLVGRRPC